MYYYLRVIIFSIQILTVHIPAQWTMSSLASLSTNINYNNMFVTFSQNAKKMSFNARIGNVFLNPICVMVSMTVWTSQMNLQTAVSVIKIFIPFHFPQTLTPRVSTPN